MNFARKLTHNEEDAEELFCEVRLKLAGRFGQFRAEGRFSSWVLESMFRHRCVQLRTKKEYGKLPECPSIDPGYERVDHGLEVDSFASGLSDIEREILSLLESGATQTEITEMMGKRGSTVRTHVYRMRRKYEQQQQN